MAVDKKSQHIGNHGGVYTDNEGMTKQFTYIDHDKKATISLSHDDRKPKDGWQEEYRTLLIERITEQPASICPLPFVDYTLRGEGKVAIGWNINMLTDKGVPISQLRDLCVLLENRADSMRLIQ